MCILIQDKAAQDVAHAGDARGERCRNNMNEKVFVQDASVRIAELDSNRLDLSGNADKAKLTKAKKSSFSDQSVQDASTGSLQEAFKKFRVRRLQRKQELTGAEAVLSLPRTDPARKAFLRARFLELARSFIGVPYARRYHVPAEGKEECECEGCTESGRQLGREPFSLDCCGLVRKVIRIMEPELGFRLGPGNQAYQYDTLPLRMASIFDLEPGDLIFYSGTYYNPAAKPYAFNMTHVEIFIGGDTGEATIGSRERQKWVKQVSWMTHKLMLTAGTGADATATMLVPHIMQYDSYAFEGKRWKLIRHHYVKIDTWLEGVCAPEHPELWQKYRKESARGEEAQEVDRRANGGGSSMNASRRLAWNASRYSVFEAGRGGEEESGEEAGDD